MKKSLSILCVAAGMVAGGVDYATAAPAKPVDRAKQARVLADDVVSAKTPAQRRAALLDVFDALNTGVYTGKGKAIVRGAEARESDAYLYDAEVRAIAAQLGDKPTTTNELLAQRVAAIGVKKRNGSAIGAAELERALAGAVRSAKRKDRFNGLGVLVVAELARQGKRPLTGSKARYDALQTWILLADLTSRKQRAAAGAASLASAAQAPKQCFPGANRLQELGTGLGSFIEAAEDIVKGVTNVASSTLHGPTIAALVDVQVAPSMTRTHYGPAGHQGTPGAPPGQNLVFRVKVEMLADVGERAIKCGSLVGLTFPKKGPVPDVPINWDGYVSNGIETLEQHGKIVSKDEKTGPDGIAELVFTPKTEVVVGGGQEKEALDVLQPEAKIFSAFGNTVGRANEAIIPVLESIPFGIGYHQPRGYRFEATTEQICFSVSGTCGYAAQKVNYTYSAKVCGASPYGGLWEGTRVRRSQQYDDAPEESTEEIEFVLFGPDKTSTTYRPLKPGDPDNRVDFTLVEGSSSRMWVDSYYSNNFQRGQPDYRTYEDHQKVSVTEATDCPELPAG